jgi:hypothetical protein
MTHEFFKGNPERPERCWSIVAPLYFKSNDDNTAAVAGYCSLQCAVTARQEHVAAEQASVARMAAKHHRAAGAGVPEQPAQGVRRARRKHARADANCMAVGNAVAGVICADGHLGYAQPVGGVIAYEKQISISGVGFDIGCGNMAVRLDTPFAPSRTGRADHQGRAQGHFVRRRPHQ